MLSRWIIALAMALLVQVTVVLSTAVVRYDFKQSGNQVLNQEQGNRTWGQTQKVQGQREKHQKLQGPQAQCRQLKSQVWQSRPVGGQRQQSQLTNTEGSGKCFLPNGSADPNGIPCFTNDNTSRCCGSDEFCSTNKLCVSKNDANKFSRGSCVDSTFQATSCPNFCQSGEHSTHDNDRREFFADNTIANNTGAVLPCGDPSLSQFCCDEGQGFACCLTPSKLFTLGKGTTFTENSPNQGATSTPNSQSQIISQPGTTRTETATQIQTQIPSATQTVIRTSVSISIQIVTTTRPTISFQIITASRPSVSTSAISFSPVASTTSSTSVLLVTTPQIQPSNSLDATRSASVFQNQNGQMTTSATNSQKSIQTQNENQVETQDIQTTLTKLFERPNMGIIIAGASAFVLIMFVSILICCIRRRKRRRAANKLAQSQDGTRRGSESEKGISENMGNKEGSGDEDAGIGVFVAVSEKFRGLKGKPNIREQEDERISREFDGALGGGMYLEGGTMGRGRPFVKGGEGLSGGERRGINARDTKDASPNIPLFSSPSFNAPRIPPSIPVSPLQALQYRESRHSRRSFDSGSSGSRYSRATTGETLRMPIRLDMPVPYRPSPIGSNGPYRMFYGEEEQGLRLGSRGVDQQQQEQPRGFI